MFVEKGHLKICHCQFFVITSFDSTVRANTFITYFYSHKNQWVVANPKMNDTRVNNFFGRISYTILVGSEIIWLNPWISNIFVKLDVSSCERLSLVVLCHHTGLNVIDESAILLLIECGFHAGLKTPFLRLKSGSQSWKMTENASNSFSRKKRKKMLVFPKNAEINASIIEKGILVGSGFIGSFDLPWSKWCRITNPNRNHPKGTHHYSIEVEAFLTETLVSGQLY